MALNSLDYTKGGFYYGAALSLVGAGFPTRDTRGNGDEGGRWQTEERGLQKNCRTAAMERVGSACKKESGRLFLVLRLSRTVQADPTRVIFFGGGGGMGKTIVFGKFECLRAFFQTGRTYRRFILWIILWLVLCVFSVVF